MRKFSAPSASSAKSAVVALAKGDIKPVVRPQEPKPPFPYKSEELTFASKAAGVTLAGTLTVPDGAVIVCADDDAGNRNRSAARTASARRARMAEPCRNVIGLCKTHTGPDSRRAKSGAFGVVSELPGVFRGVEEQVPHRS